MSIPFITLIHSDYLEVHRRKVWFQVWGGFHKSISNKFGSPFPFTFFSLLASCTSVALVSISVDVCRKDHLNLNISWSFHKPFIEYLLKYLLFLKRLYRSKAEYYYLPTHITHPPNLSISVESVLAAEM